mmetsp:Transcript_7367/g.25363  ORF Transcript_7367/g.25363 Transcript_7367/m.25363 type:complete len:205 (+) Transcript_7367:2217-2831(+)
MGTSETVASERASPSRKSGAPRSLRNISKRDCSPVAPKPATMATRRKTKYFALGIRRLADSRNARPVPLPSSQDGSLEKSRESTIPATAAMDAPASPKAAWFPRNWTIVPPTSDPAPQPTAPHSLILPYSCCWSPRNRRVCPSRRDLTGASSAAIDRATARADAKLCASTMSCTGTMPTRIEATHACLWIWYLSTRTLIAGLTR